MALLKTISKRPRKLDVIDNGDFKLVENLDGSITKIFSNYQVTIDNKRRCETIENLETGMKTYTEWDKEGRHTLSSLETEKVGKKIRIVINFCAGKFLKEERFENNQCVYVRDKSGTAVFSTDGKKKKWFAPLLKPEKER